jgi:hypothetical protein
MLLLGAGLLIRSLELLLQTNPGFQPAHVLTFRVSLPPATYRQESQYAAFFDQLTERLASLPGVEAVGAVSGFTLRRGQEQRPSRSRASRWRLGNRSGMPTCGLSRDTTSER